MKDGEIKEEEERERKVEGETCIEREKNHYYHSFNATAIFASHSTHSHDIVHVIITHLKYDMQHEPTRPCPLVVATQQDAQRQ